METSHPTVAHTCCSNCGRPPELFRPRNFGPVFGFITMIRTGLIEADDDNAINLVLNADTIFPDRVYLKRWKDPDKADALIKVKEELESVKCYSIEISRGEYIAVT